MKGLFWGELGEVAREELGHAEGVDAVVTEHLEGEENHLVIIFACIARQGWAKRCVNASGKVRQKW